MAKSASPPKPAQKTARTKPAKKTARKGAKLDFCPFCMPSEGGSHQQEGTPCW
jgi:hypothetical protein